MFQHAKKALLSSFSLFTDLSSIRNWKTRAKFYFYSIFKKNKASCFMSRGHILGGSGVAAGVTCAREKYFCAPTTKCAEESKSSKWKIVAKARKNQNSTFANCFFFSILIKLVGLESKWTMKKRFDIKSGQVSVHCSDSATSSNILPLPKICILQIQAKNWYTARFD